jgi:hypothetical protein
LQLPEQWIDDDEQKNGRAEAEEDYGGELAERLNHQFTTTLPMP